MHNMLVSMSKYWNSKTKILDLGECSYLQFSVYKVKADIALGPQLICEQNKALNKDTKTNSGVKKICFVINISAKLGLEKIRWVP